MLQRLEIGIGLSGVTLCRLDYCNSLLYDISDVLLRRLQTLQNAAACLITGARWCNHITLILRELRWLPLCQRIHFKIAAFVVYRVFTG